MAPTAVRNLSSSYPRSLTLYLYVVARMEDDAGFKVSVETESDCCHLIRPLLIAYGKRNPASKSISDEQQLMDGTWYD